MSSAFTNCMSPPARRLLQVRGIRTRPTFGMQQRTPPASASTSASASRPPVSGQPSSLTPAEARQQAWYLNLDPPPHKPSPSSSSPSSTSAPRRPVFSSYSADTMTSALPSSQPIRPLPRNAPSQLAPLHTYLTTSEEAAEVLDPSSIVFLHTPSAAIRDFEGGELFRGGDGEEVGVGGRWEWIGVGEVRGRGRGTVARAERMIRRWINAHPLTDTEAPPLGGQAKMRRVDPETDWSMIPLPEVGLCLNLMTQEGRERWGLEKLWRAGDKRETVSDSAADERDLLENIEGRVDPALVEASETQGLEEERREEEERERDEVKEAVRT